MLKFRDFYTCFECCWAIERVLSSLYKLHRYKKVSTISSRYILSRQELSVFLFSPPFHLPPLFLVYICSTHTHTHILIYICLSHTPPPLCFLSCFLLGWSSRDNGRLIITMKLSWFSAPLGAMGRAAAASEIDPSALPLIIQKHKFSWAWNLLVSSQMTVGSCATCLHMYVLVDVCESEKVR